MASAILSAKDIHNHLVPLALSRGTRVVATRVVPSSISFYEGMLGRFFPYPKKEGDPVQKRISRCLRFFLPSFLPSSRLVSNSLDFLLLLPVPFDARENFRNFARPFKANAHGAKKRSSVYILRGRRREREIKDGDLASFRASLLFGPVLFCRSALLY